MGERIKCTLLPEHGVIVEISDTRERHVTGLGQNGASIPVEKIPEAPVDCPMLDLPGNRLSVGFMVCQSCINKSENTLPDSRAGYPRGGEHLTFTD